MTTESTALEVAQARGDDKASLVVRAGRWASLSEEDRRRRAVEAAAARDVGEL